MRASTSTRAILTTLLLTLACTKAESDRSTPSKDEPSKDEPSKDEKAAQAPPPAGAPAPEGFVMPSSARVRELIAGDRGTAYRWKGVFEARPDDPSLAPHTKEGRDAGDAALALYGEQIEAAGLGRGFDGMSVSYFIQDRSLHVMCRSDDDFHAGDPTGFSCFVGAPGG